MHEALMLFAIGIQLIALIAIAKIAKPTAKQLMNWFKGI